MQQQGLQFNTVDDVLLNSFIWPGTIDKSRSESNGDKKPVVKGTKTINERLNRPTPKRKLSYK